MARTENPEGPWGLQNELSGSSEYNALTFLIGRVLAGRNHAALVQVKAVTNSGGVSAVGFVDVRPMVHQLDGQKNAIPHGVIYGLPYFRLQGGTDAIILDPKVGDIGIAVFADRDISSVKATRKPANPGSMRQADWADGLYLGGFLNGIPTQYIQFAADGIHITSPTKVFIDAPNIAITGNTAFTGQVSANGKRIDDTHKHGGVQTGAGQTGTVV